MTLLADKMSRRHPAQSNTNILIKTFVAGVITALCVWTCTCYAQENYMEGYVIVKGDTIKGRIDNKIWTTNPSRIVFKTGAGEKKIYTPLTVERFAVADEFYAGAIVSVESSPYRDQDLRRSNNLEFRTDTVFLRAIFQGPKSLYHYQDNMGKEHFIIGKENQFETLVYKRFIKDFDGGEYISDVNRYIGQLALYLDSCASIHTALRGIQYKKSSLVNLFKEYSKCIGTPIALEKKKDKTLFRFGFITGYCSSKLGSFTFGGGFSSTQAFLTKANFSNSNTITGGVSLDIVFPRNQQKWSMHSEFLLSNFDFSGTSRYANSTTHYTLSSYSAAATYLNFNNLVRYSIPVQDISIFFNVGPALGFFLSSSANHVTSRDIFGSGGSVAAVDGSFVNFSKVTDALLVGAGVAGKHLTFDARVEFGNGLEDGANSAPITSLYFLVGYRF